MDMVKEAMSVINTHSYYVCDTCSKGKRCRSMCMPLMIMLNVYESRGNDREEYLNKIEVLFEDIKEEEG